MDRIKALNQYQKVILLLLAAMIVTFGVVYSVVSSRVGFLYMDSILQPSEENGNTVYAGKIENRECSFTVTPGNEVTFRWADKVYGPYTMMEDPSAVPAHDLSAHMTGVEIRDGGEVIFRGGIFETGGSNSYRMLYTEDGASASFNITVTMGDGTMVDGDGNVIDRMEPSLHTILDLMEGPELTKKGQWIFWFLGVFASVMTAVSILFADELFRLHLVFRVRNVDDVEPNDWEIGSRYIAWTVMPIMALVFYLIGLQ